MKEIPCGSALSGLSPEYSLRYSYYLHEALRELVLHGALQYPLFQFLCHLKDLSV